MADEYINGSGEEDTDSSLGTDVSTARVDINDFVNLNIAQIAPDVSGFLQSIEGLDLNNASDALDGGVGLPSGYAVSTANPITITPDTWSSDTGNTTQPNNGSAYYETYVEIMDGRFSGTQRMAELVSGMEVVVDIVGGKRTILDYVMTPFNRATSVVFREN